MTFGHLAGAAALLGDLRDAVAINFGDYGLGMALASLQGAQLRFRFPAMCCCVWSLRSAHLRSLARSSVLPAVRVPVAL